MAENFFHMKRAGRIMAEGVNQDLSLLIRYHGAADRAFNSNLRELRKLQKERKIEEIGFVSQQAAAPPLEAPDFQSSTPQRPIPTPIPVRPPENIVEIPPSSPSKTPPQSF